MAKRIIECQVSDEYILGAGMVVGAAGSHDDVLIRLAFGDMWIGLNLYATFRDSKGESPTLVAILPSMLADGEVMVYDVPVPAAAKKYEGKMMLTISGYSVVDGTEEDTATNTATAYFRVLRSDFAMFDDASVDATLAQQIHNEINEFGEVVKAFGERLDEHEEVYEDTKALKEEIETKLENGEFTPKRGIDYYTPEDVEGFEAIIAAKAANLGGFIPISPAPLWESGANVNKTTATITSVVANGDGSHSVTFNKKSEALTDGGFENYAIGDSLVPVDSMSKGANGWTGFSFSSNTGRYATVTLGSSNGESHSGNAYIRVMGAWSSLCKSVKLKPYTKYNLSFWQRGVAGKKISSIVACAKAYDGDVIYRTSSGAVVCDTSSSEYQVLYNRGGDNLNDAVIQQTDVWQKFSVDFTTQDREYVDICIYFAGASTEFCFDDFSITEVLGEEFVTSYAAGVSVPPEVAVGSVFYVERDNGRAFVRFDYASSIAIQQVYDYVESLSGAAYKKLEDDVGDIAAALDELHNYAESLIGGA